MRALFRDGLLFIGCVVVPCAVGWRLENPTEWQWIHGVGAGLFVLATLMVFAGLRLLLTAPGPTGTGPAESQSRAHWRTGPGSAELEALAAEAAGAPGPRPFPASSEIIHIEHKGETARVVALLRLGEGPHDVHLLELDVSGEDLRREVIEEAVAGVATGEPSETAPPIDRVGYASGWGLTLPCPPLRH